MNPPNQPASGFRNYRWVICSLLFFATTFNYLDRQVISYLHGFFCSPVAEGGFGWSNTDFAFLTSFFTGIYAAMTVLAGWFIDKIGTKLGLALSLIAWSIFGILNAFVGGLLAMHILVRSFFAVGEAGNFPASIKTIAEWFPKRERALATAVFNSGSNFGAMVAALFVPWCLIHFGNELGWKLAFIITGASGFVWLIFWFWLYDTPDKQKRLSKAEYDYIHIDQDDVKSEEKPRQGLFGNLFSFSGRIPRAAFWGTSIIIGGFILFIWAIAQLAGKPEAFHSLPAKLFFTAVAILAAWVGLALQTKRWHDLDKTGWLILINLVPVIGTVVSFVILGFSKGRSDGNRFGNEGRPGLLGHRQTWAFCVGKFMTDGIWWFYLFWLPDYLIGQFHMTNRGVMLPTFIIYGVAIIGSIYGGSIPLTLIKKGWPVYKARMTSMLIIAMFPLAVLSTQYFGNVDRFGQWALVLAIAIICVGTTSHQAWSANLFTTVSDMFPKRTVASVTGIGTMAGGVGGVLIQILQGRLRDAFPTPQTAYLIMFFVCALSYLIAWGIMKALVPRHQPITDL